jgi:hypothetical protein
VRLQLFTELQPLARNVLARMAGAEQNANALLGDTGKGSHARQAVGASGVGCGVA